MFKYFWLGTVDQERQDSETVPGIEELFDNLEEFLKEIDDWDETKDNLPINPGSFDTLLLSNENLLMKLAPGEGRKPLYFSQDKFIEELAYPCVFASHCRDLPEDLSILKKSKSDILRLVMLSNNTYNFNLYYKHYFVTKPWRFIKFKLLCYIHGPMRYFLFQLQLTKLQYNLSNLVIILLISSLDLIGGVALTSLCCFSNTS